jgi:DNA-binding transcriptional MocR family regulator
MTKTLTATPVMTTDAMTCRLARRMRGLKASDIRELLKVTAHPDIISFAGGLPAPELFPVEALISISTEILRDEGARALQYSTTEGDPELRTAIAARMSRRLQAEVSPQEVQITSGSQQALDLTSKLLLDEGDIVLCESPTYIGAIQAFRACQPRFIEVATDDSGMDLADLERRLAGLDRAKLIYVVPDFQNPSGRCWTAARRRGLVDLARQYDVMIVEDCPYGELRFHGHEVPPVKSFDEEGRVIYLGTFSKVFCPGLRIGWVVAHRHLIERYVLAKQGTDLHTSTLSQRQLAVYLTRHDLDEAINTIRETYRERRDIMLRTLDAEMPDGVSYTRPDGGLFLWAELPEHLDARQLLLRCIENKVAFVPGGSFFPNGGHENTLRLAFSTMSPERIEEGIRRLARVLREQLAGQSAAPALAAAVA